MAKIYQKIKAAIKDNTSLFIIVILIHLFLFAYLFNNIVYVIRSGQAGVTYLLFFGGTVVDEVLPEGIHFIWPWDKIYIYNVRIQETFHEFDVLTKNGLKLHLLISVRYRPEYNLLGVLHKNVGKDYLTKVVLPEIESVLRIIIGQIEAEEVYTTKTSLIQESLNDAIEQVSQRFVKVDDVIIKRIILPASVQKTIQYKMEQKHLAEAHLFKIEREKREAERKRIESEGYRRYNEILSSSLSEEILHWKGIEATLALSESENSKVVIIGGGKRGLPIFGNIAFDETLPDNTGKSGASSEEPAKRTTEESGSAEEHSSETTDEAVSSEKSGLADFFEEKLYSEP
ncbi:prohibitin family protein [Desulfobacterales bacterium HSG2]|nr:prohibitin family protein [Desulfobacterales bacterium HSG2]